MDNIFLLSKSDWLRLIDAVNIHAGEYIIITRTSNGLEISIDEGLIRRQIRLYMAMVDLGISYNR